METKNASTDGVPTNTPIYVGDLSPKTLESDLYRIFSAVGTVTSIKMINIATDIVNPHASKCYAYISYLKKEDADNAVMELNFTELHGKKMRVMHYDKSLVKSVAGKNIIVKNLPDSVDSQLLYNTFKVFGDIMSCKVPTTSKGKSKGFGFIQFKDPASAKKAIDLANKCLMRGNKLKIEKYVSKDKVVSGKNVLENKFTNVYIKNFPSNITENDLTNILTQYGEITSFYMPLKENGQPKGFAFANFSENSSALEAIKNLHNKYVFTETEDDSVKCQEPFYIQRAQLKEEREEEMRNYISKMSLEGQNYKRNLYVTNIPSCFEELEVKDVFKKFGNIVSFALGKDFNVENGVKFAYVCYSTPDEASIAVEKGNEIYLDGQKLSVAFFKNKMERAAAREINSDSFSYQPDVGLGYSKIGMFGGSMPSFFNNMKENIISNGDMGYGNRKPYEDKKQLENDLYGVVLQMAPTFSKEWPILGVKNEEEFSRKMTDLLIQRPSCEIKIMVGLGNILDFNIKQTLNSYGENRDSDSSKIFKFEKK
ncbi:polyadenylate-binding protein [Hamiltosporidium tvaerminnensis]|uniref:Polyadenylate-binding protein n=2 Tax=Hamiltosporidium TaxID=1176354 RepID=A0A4Q9LDK6_9MICR|nr:hypothetical protein LUQ84_000292 [Hamiltosporidium tvaerminnensis]TBU07075.1 polyadenylate-binding protein [Hamiltosporidium magnivora]TBU05121.1 polyadenylate-binding protein [Hamiltosporidium tvaerminnensis]TBU05306.1 polyadenylate-binding protein [Hamiltosporidium tvaerminnensis]TBU12356.1 polyadenylate-binding protein [Hamiltosporidium tvaerminnensis]